MNKSTFLLSCVLSLGAAVALAQDATVPVVLFYGQPHLVASYPYGPFINFTYSPPAIAVAPAQTTPAPAQVAKLYGPVEYVGSMPAYYAPTIYYNWPIDVRPVIVPTRVGGSDYGTASALPERTVR